MKLADYLKAERGRQAALCAEIGAYAPDVSRWATGERAIPAVWCVAIERATGGAVTRQEMRPNDWRSYWPELEAA